MNPDVLVLALASAPRPAAIAALYALLSASPPRRVVVAYLVAGLTFSVALGVLVVAIFNGAGIDYRGTDVYSVIELLGGVAALGFAIGVKTGRRQLPARDEGAGGGSAIIQRLRNPSVTTALVAGIATHLPGLFYLIALQAIVAERRSLVVGAMEVLLFNVIWFGATIASVVLFLLRPGVARRALARVERVGTTSRPHDYRARLHRGRLLPGDQGGDGPGRLRPRRLGPGARPPTPATGWYPSANRVSRPARDRLPLSMQSGISPCRQPLSRGVRRTGCAALPRCLR
jgi:Sap, sulfolipid-1-addressing protein